MFLCVCHCNCNHFLPFSSLSTEPRSKEVKDPSINSVYVSVSIPTCTQIERHYARLASLYILQRGEKKERDQLQCWTEQNHWGDSQLQCHIELLKMEKYLENKVCTLVCLIDIRFLNHSHSFCKFKAVLIQWVHSNTLIGKHWLIPGLFIYSTLSTLSRAVLC